MRLPALSRSLLAEVELIGGNDHRMPHVTYACSAGQLPYSPTVEHLRKVGPSFVSCKGLPRGIARFLVASWQNPHNDAFALHILGTGTVKYCASFLVVFSSASACTNYFCSLHEAGPSVRAHEPHHVP